MKALIMLMLLMPIAALGNHKEIIKPQASVPTTAVSEATTIADEEPIKTAAVRFAGIGKSAAKGIVAFLYEPTHTVKLLLVGDEWMGIKLLSADYDKEVIMVSYEGETITLYLRHGTTQIQVPANEQ